MQIDPSQPIMFDTETGPGRGTGMWQVNTYSSPSDTARAAGRGSPIIFLIAFAIILAGGGHMLFT